MMYKPHFPSIQCKDGTTLSVQASQSHYSTPRQDKGPYTHVEVGFPSVTPPASWKPYADGDYPSDVYGWVPLEAVAAFIESHGGIDVVATFNRKYRDE